MDRRLEPPSAHAVPPLRPLQPPPPRKKRQVGDPLPQRMPQRSNSDGRLYSTVQQMRREKKGDGRKTRDQRTVFRDKKGRFCRAPKPKPPTPLDTPEFQECETADPELLTAALIQQAEQVESKLTPDLALLVVALCDRLKKREAQYQELKASRKKVVLKLSNAREQLKDQHMANKNLHHQSTRYWEQVQRLRKEILNQKVQEVQRQDRILSCGMADDESVG